MNRITIAVSALVTVLLVGAVASPPVDARGRHFDRRDGGRFHVYLGVPLPWYWGYPAPYPYYPYYPYYPPAVSQPSQPPVYIEKGQEQAAAPQQGYWYYCRDPAGYYPYVRECPGGWEPVAPQPPAQK